MAYSYKEHISVSVTDAGRTYTFTFDAVAKDTTNIKVTFGGKHLYDGITKYNTGTRQIDTASGTVQSAEYTVSSGSISILSSVTFTVGGVTVTSGVPQAVTSSNLLRIFRETNRDTAEVSFSSGSVLADSDLNKANNQARFLSLEAVDRANEALAIDPSDSTQYDATVSGATKRISGLADPDDGDDAANKSYVDAVATGSGASIVTDTSSSTLSNKTLTSPVVNGAVTGTAILNSDTMSGASDTLLATADSIKTYVDNQVGGANLDFQGDEGSGSLTIDLATETFSLIGGTGITTAGSGNQVSVAIDSTVSTKANATSEAILYSIALG